MQSEYDVIIVGGGLVGLVFAALLVKQELKVALLEMQPLEKVALKEEYQLRVSALNLACKDMFSELNIWDIISASNRLSAFEKMFVWDSLGRGEIHFDCTELAQPCLGFIVENAVIHNALLDELASHPNLDILANQKPIALAMDSKGIVLQYQTNEASAHNNEKKIIKAELLVGADGAQSWVRQQANIETYMWPYHHNALVTTVETELPHQKTAWQCFLADGPLALLPLHNKHVCSIVWSGLPDEIMRLQNLKKTAFDWEITNAFEHRLGAISKISDQVTIPLFMRHAKQYVKHRVALIGDAAHTIHPLAGQGINLGFADAYTLAKQIIQAKHRRQDCGEYTMLRKYERTRKSDNWVMIFGMEFFKRLFQSEAFITQQMRSWGLQAVNKVGFIKEQFIYRAMGR